MKVNQNEQARDYGIEHELQSIDFAQIVPYFNNVYSIIREKDRMILNTKTRKKISDLDHTEEMILRLSDGKHTIQSICENLYSVLDVNSKNYRFLRQKMTDFFNNGITIFTKGKTEIGHRNLFLGEKIFLSENTLLGCNNIIHGPCHLKNTNIQSFSYIGPRVKICNSFISSFCNVLFDVTIKGAYLNSHVHIKDHVEIGDCVFIASHVQIEGKQHYNLYPPLFVGREDYKLRKTRIGNFVWIGSGAKIFDVEVGDWSVIGAGALVNKDIPPYCIAYGVPTRTKSITYKLNQSDRKYEVGVHIGRNQFRWRQKLRGLERDKEKTETFFGKRMIQVDHSSDAIKMIFEACPVHEGKIGNSLCPFHKGLIAGTFELNKNLLSMVTENHRCIFEFRLPTEWSK